MTQNAQRKECIKCFFRRLRGGDDGDEYPRGWNEAFIEDPNGIWIEYLERK